MTLPGFTAEVSFETTPARYRTQARRRQVHNLVGPASCDTHCLAQCYANGPDCSEVGHVPGGCGRAIASYRAQCRQSCCN